jgi:biotin transport system substrate-specific component
MASIVIAPKRSTLADYLSMSRLGTLSLVAGFAVLLGLSAQISIPLGFTPVPLTGQTFAVLVGAAALGPVRALGGSALYLALGLAGVPWFAGGAGGVSVASAPTFGYLVGFLVASLVVGLMARRGFDRRFIGMAAVMIVGNVVIYAFGATWLAASIHVSLAKAITLGVTPFLIGDLIKLALADALVPSIWKGIKRSGHLGA